MLISSGYDILRLNCFCAFSMKKNVQCYEHVFTTWKQDKLSMVLFAWQRSWKEKKINSAWSTLMLVVLLLQPIHSRWYDSEKERKCKGL